MQKILYLFLLVFMSLQARDCNLVIIIDNLHQETVKTEEVNMTHQCVTALQQRASAVLMSAGLWKNIMQRKKNFEKQLQDSSSLAAALFDVYQVTNQELQRSRYNLVVINQKLSHVWFFEKYPKLAELSQDDFNQLRFDFLCYMFEFDIAQWRVYHTHAGMLLFVPVELDYAIDHHLQLHDEADLTKNTDKKSNVVQSLQKLLVDSQDCWVVYLTGHGHPKSSKQGANIAGLKIDEFKDLLHFFNESMQLKLLMYASCYGGGVHTVEPYTNITLHYPVIVTALTDAPIFGFGLFEGVKLPPYDDQFKLQASDVSKNKGLLPYAMQDYGAFFKRAWKGQFDLNLVQLVSRFFMCDLLQCHIQKIENFPLIRKAGDFVFIPIKDGLMTKLVQQVTAPHTIISVTKPLLLYTKKIKKIKMDRALPIVSMLPGLVSHEIDELLTSTISLSTLLSETFLSLEDMQSYKNFIIHKLVCLADLSGQEKIETFSRVFILGQENIKPKFIDKQVDALIYVQLTDKHYLFIWQEHKISKPLLLDEDQIQVMIEVGKFVQKSVDLQLQESPISFEGYLENKRSMQEIIDNCIKEKICKKA